jgi:hypothetical protein
MRSAATSNILRYCISARRPIVLRLAGVDEGMADSPYFWPHSMYVLCGWLLGRSRTLPTSGRPGGPGGSGRDERRRLKTWFTNQIATPTKVTSRTEIAILGDRQTGRGSAAVRGEEGEGRIRGSNRYEGVRRYTLLAGGREARRQQPMLELLLTLGRRNVSRPYTIFYPATTRARTLAPGASPTRWVLPRAGQRSVRPMAGDSPRGHRSVALSHNVSLISRCPEPTQVHPRTAKVGPHLG